MVSRNLVCSSISDELAVAPLSVKPTNRIRLAKSCGREESLGIPSGKSFFQALSEPSHPFAPKQGQECCRENPERREKDFA